MLYVEYNKHMWKVFVQHNLLSNLSVSHNSLKFLFIFYLNSIIIMNFLKKLCVYLNFIYVRIEKGESIGQLHHNGLVKYSDWQIILIEHAQFDYLTIRSKLHQRKRDFDLPPISISQLRISEQLPMCDCLDWISFPRKTKSRSKIFCALYAR